MKHSWRVERLATDDSDSIAQAAELLDAMSQYHTDNVPEVFDEHRLPKTVEYIEGLLGDKDTQVWVVREGDQVIGVLHGAVKASEPNPGWRDRRYGYIEATYVRESHRKQGIGKVLVLEAQRYFKEQRLEVVELNVWAFNATANRLYTALGYTAKNTNLWHKL